MRYIRINILIVISLFLFGCSSPAIATATSLNVDCNKAPVYEPESQLSYMGLFPGKSSEKDAYALLGPPLTADLGDTYKNLTYATAYIHLGVSDKTIHDIFV